MGIVGKLTRDPAGAATGPASLTLGAAIYRRVMEQERAQTRQTMVGGGEVHTRALSSDPVVRGSVGLHLSTAERVTVHGWFDELIGGETLRVFPDSTDAATYTDVVIEGTSISERYEWLGPDVWRITIPAVEV